ncbi:MAG: aromatic ring-opening dioxygenase LigA [Jiangellaceae bacterium]
MAATTVATGRIRVLATLVAIAGVVMVLAGGATWFVVRDQLMAENITVADDADMLAGEEVAGPLTAYAQADVINEHALEASGGRTYAEIPQEDESRQTVMTASFLRASLFTSVVSFGVAAMAAGIGLVFLLIAWALFGVARSLGVAAATPDLDRDDEPGPIY